VEALLDRRAGISAGEFPELVKCSWPLGRLVLYEDRVVVRAVSASYELRYDEIDAFQFNPILVNIEHHSASAPKDISVNGFFIARAVRKAVREHCLPVAIK
jgi:hypothetical protein